MPRHLRAFYTPRKNRQPRPAMRVVRYKFISFKYVKGGVVDKQLSAIQSYLLITGRAATARQAVYIAAKSMSIESARKVLAQHTPEPMPREWLRIESVPDEVNLADALSKVKLLIATARAIDVKSVTNKLAYEVSIAYVAERVEKYAEQDAQE